MNTKHTAAWQALGFAAALAAAGSAQAALPLITDDARTQGYDRKQLELQGMDADGRGGGRDFERYDAIFSYGLGESLDAQAGLPWYRTGPDGVGDASLALKWRFLQRGAWGFALKPGITVPTGDEADGRGTGRVTWGVRGIMSYVPGAVSVHAHVGYRRNENKLDQRESLHELAAAAGYQIDSVRFVAEASRETNPVRGGQTVRYTTVGVIWEATPGFHLDAGWRQGHGGAAIEDALLIGTTFRW